MDVVTLGSATIDAFLQVAKATEHIKVEDGELKIHAGDKIEVDSCIFSLGGNACNVAVGLSRLGFASGVCAEIGTDEFSSKITNGLDAEHVSRDFLLQTQGASSSFAIALNVSAERTLFVEHVKREHQFSLSALDAKWMYVTSLGDEWTQAYESIVPIVTEKNISLAFSPGTHQLDNPYEQVKALFPLTRVLFVNKQEAMALSEFYLQKTTDDIQELLEALPILGPKIVSITDGGNGGYAIDETKQMWHMPVVPQEIVERTGAGDGYATAFLGAIMDGKAIPDAMGAGAVNAASVIGSIGAQKGLLTKENLAQKLSEYADLVPEKL